MHSFRMNIVSNQVNYFLIFVNRNEYANFLCSNQLNIINRNHEDYRNKGIKGTKLLECKPI